MKDIRVYSLVPPGLLSTARNEPLNPEPESLFGIFFLGGGGPHPVTLRGPYRITGVESVLG